MPLPALLRPIGQPVPLAADALADAERHWAAARTILSRRPAPGSTTETSALGAIGAFLRSYAVATHGHTRAIVRDCVNRALRQIFDDELARRDPKIDYALRQLERAVDRFGVFGEVITQVLDEVRLEDIATAFGAGAPPSELVSLLRALAAIFMGFQALAEQEDGQLLFWALEADVGWRVIAAHLPDLAARIAAGD